MNKKGITLLELIIVIVIMAILAVLVISPLLGLPDKAKQRVLKTQINEIHQQLNLYIEKINQGLEDVYVINTLDNLRTNHFYHKYFIPFPLIEKYLNENYILDRGKIYCLITISNDDYQLIKQGKMTFKEATFEITELIYQLPNQTIQYFENSYSEISNIPLYKQNYLF